MQQKKEVKKVISPNELHLRFEVKLEVKLIAAAENPLTFHELVPAIPHQQ